MLLWFILIIMALFATFFIVASPIKNRWLLFSLILFIPIFSLIVYWQSGRYEARKKYQIIQGDFIKAKKEIETSGTPATLIQQLKAKTQANPKDTQAWYLLGKLYLGSGQPKSALKAFQKAETLAPNSKKIHFSRIQASFLINKKLSDREKAFLKKLAKNQADAFEAWNILALSAYQEKNYPKAIQYWEILLKKLPAEATEEKASIQKMLEKVKNL
jgi:cytochrome c-type biogenesis protein CcmH